LASDPNEAGLDFRGWRGAVLRNRGASPLVAKGNAGGGRRKGEGGAMLYWAVVFLIIAIIAGVLGFGGIAATAAGIAKVLFFIFIVIFAIALIMGLARRGPPPL
jgi:uncharacterized membrane protein YtjA (UPF0391 family)